MARRRGGKKHNKGKKNNKKEATQEEDTECECDLLCGNKVTVALECCNRTKRLCATCFQQLLYVTKVTGGTGSFFANDLKMSDLGIAFKCPFCRTKLLYDRPKDFENGNKAIVKAMMLRPQESPEVFKTPNGDTLCLLDLKLPKECGRGHFDDTEEKVGEVLFKFSPSKGPKSELKGCILFNETSLFNSFPLAQRLHRTTGQ